MNVDTNDYVGLYLSLHIKTYKIYVHTYMYMYIYIDVYGSWSVQL